MLLYTPDVFIEGFSISHAAIIEYNTITDLFEEEDIYGVRSGTIEARIESTEETSNDQLVNVWNSINGIDINIESGYLSLAMMQRFTGSSRFIDGLYPESADMALDLWTPNNMNPGFVSMVVRIPARDSSGVFRSLEFVFYRVKLKPYSFDTASYKDGLTASYQAIAFLSSTDENGLPLVPDDPAGPVRRAYGRLVSHSTGSRTTSFIEPTEDEESPIIPTLDLIYPAGDSYPSEDIYPVSGSPGNIGSHYPSDGTFPSDSNFPDN
jgi:hypothetical protein